MSRFLLTMTMLTALLLAQACGRTDPLPTDKQVKSLSIRLNHLKLGEVSFSGTAKDWAAIQEALTPSTRDTTPASWEWMGSAELTLQDGEPYRVELYHTSRAPGAFAVGKTFKERVYYRGGKPGDLYKALVAAFDKSDDVEVETIKILGVFRRADKVEIKVAKESGGFYDTITLLDAKEKDEILPLAELLKFDGNGVPREPGNVGTTVAADITAFRKGKAFDSLRLRGNEIWFGPKHGYQATLKSDEFYRQLRKLVRDPLQ